MGLCSGLMAWGQGPRGGRSERGGFSLANLSAAQKEIPDSLLLTDSVALKAKRLTAFHVITQTGARTVAPLDTNQLNFGQTTLLKAMPWEPLIWPMWVHRDSR